MGTEENNIEANVGSTDWDNGAFKKVCDTRMWTFYLYSLRPRNSVLPTFFKSQTISIFDQIYTKI
jgi:hypothetical protein